MKEDKGRIYDVERDGPLEAGDKIIIREDGSREIIKNGSNDEENARTKKHNA